MTLIDRYIYTVTRYLPESMKNDVSSQLRATIDARLPENPTPSDIEKVLKELGNPWKKANEYQPNKLYLIGPNYYDHYLTVLKLVLSIVATVLILLTIVQAFTQLSLQVDQPQSYIKLFTNLFSSVISGLFQAIAWVTIVFVIIERSSMEGTQTDSEWNLSDLPQVSQPKLTISRGEAFVELSVVIFMTFLILTQPQIIGYFEKVVENDVLQIVKVPLFDITKFSQYSIVIVVSSVFTITMSIWKLIAGHWNMKLIIGNIISNVVVVVAAMIILLDNSIYNYDFFEKLAEIFKVSPLNVEISFKYGVWITLIIIVLTSLVDCMVPLIRYIRNNKRVSNDL